MTQNDFMQSLDEDHPPIRLTNVYLLALWYDHKGDWTKAHALIQDLNDITAQRIHAYLHRKEGDQWNADYWYRRSGFKAKDWSLEEEWADIVHGLL